MRFYFPKYLSTAKPLRLLYTGAVYATGVNGNSSSHRDWLAN